MEINKVNFNASFGGIYIPKTDKPIRKIVQAVSEELDELSRYTDISIIREKSPIVIAGAEKNEKCTIASHALKVILSPIRQKDSIVTASCTISVPDKKSAPQKVLKTAQHLFQLLFTK